MRHAWRRDRRLVARARGRLAADVGLAQVDAEQFTTASCPATGIARIEQLAERGATKLWVGVSGRDLDVQRHYSG